MSRHSENVLPTVLRIEGNILTLPLVTSNGAKPDVSVITENPIKPGWGLIYQGVYADSWLKMLPGKFMIVQMNTDTEDSRLIDQKKICSVINIRIEDWHGAALKDDAYLALIMSIIAYLKQGISVYIHCSAGVSRSSYVTLGVLMASIGWDYDKTIAFLRIHRPCAEPNEGFVKHLRLLEGKLRCLEF